MAKFCAATGYTPQQFYDMSLMEYEALVDEMNKRNKK